MSCGVPGLWIKTYSISKGSVARVLLAVGLAWYVILGLRTQLAFPFTGTLMVDLDIAIRTFLRASKGLNPYSVSDIWTAYFYPLPSLLIVGLFSPISDLWFRAAAHITMNLAVLALMLTGIGTRYGYRLEQIWWWFPLAFGFAPLLELLYVGQINLISSFGIFLMLVYTDTAPALAGFGAMLGTVTKLTPGIFFVYLAMQFKPRAVIWGFVCLAAAFAIAFLRFGWQPPDIYLRVVSTLSQRFNAGANSVSLVSGLNSIGLMEQGAWPEVEHLLLVWIAVLFATSALCALVSRQWEPLFIVLSLGTIVSPNHMWYHHYVFILLPLFVWMAWSRLQPAIVAWCILGLGLIQVDRWYWTQGLMAHTFVQLTIVGIVVWQLAQGVRTSRVMRTLVGAGAVPALVVIGWFAHGAVNANENLIQAREWINANLPPGSRLAYDLYAPSLDEKNYRTAQFPNLNALPADWYGRNGWEYLITTYGNHGVLFPLPGYSANSNDPYREFFSKFSSIAAFSENGYETRIYRTNAKLPSQRTMARVGVQGEWLEFLGYDSNGSKWRPGQTMNLAFYWLPMERRQEHLQLTVRLLDPKDHEMGHAQGDLFGPLEPDGRWPDGIARVPWKIDLPADAAPGLYRLELDVDALNAEGIGRLPVLSQDRQPISDKIYIGPFKMSPAEPSPDDISRLTSVNARFRDGFALQGYSLGQATARPGQSIKVQLYWQSIEKSDKDWTVFVHLLDAVGALRAQLDARPFDGAYPTLLWDPGQAILDQYTLRLPTGLPSGEYSIELGLYEYPSMVRLPMIDAAGQNLGDRLLLKDVVQVVASSP